MIRREMAASGMNARTFGTAVPQTSFEISSVGSENRKRQAEPKNILDHFIVSCLLLEIGVPLFSSRERFNGLVGDAGVFHHRMLQGESIALAARIIPGMSSTDMRQLHCLCRPGHGGK